MTFDPVGLKDHVSKAVTAAEGATRFTGPIIEGMTSTKVRHLLQGVCCLPGGHYLEIGAWKGATFLAACVDSPLAQATVIENWSTFGGPRAEFQKNLADYDARLPSVTLIEEDCWETDLRRIAPAVDIYFYDGGHREIDQERAITRFWSRLADPSVILIDDWNDPNYDVPGATTDGLNEMKATIYAEWELGGDCQRDYEGWWNGLYVAVVKGGWGEGGQ